MKRIYTTLFIIVFLTSTFSQFRKTVQNNSANFYSNFKILDINRVLLKENNIGNLNTTTYDNLFRNTGAIWMQLDSLVGKYIVYDKGLWFVGKIDTSLYLSYSAWRNMYSPGPVINNRPALSVNPSDSLRYRIYKINKGDDNSNPDYAQWPSDLGAPTNSNGKPKILGDQLLWTVYNSADSNNSNRLFWNIHQDRLPPFPIEIQESIYGRKGDVKDNIDIFSNTVFLEYTIINKGNEQIDSAFIGLWTDIDFYEITQNPFAIDTINQLAYLYSSIDTMVSYNTHNNKFAPPAVGFVQLFGPIVPDVGSKAVYKGNSINNFKNLPLSSFHGIFDDSDHRPLEGTINTKKEAWNAARGLDLAGNKITDPTIGKETKFPFSGNPITNKGWIYNEVITGSGAGFVIFNGPFNLAPKDTQWVMYGIIPAEGNNRFESISLLKQKAAILRSLPYDSLAYGVIPYKLNFIDSTNVYNNLIPNEFKLFQNFPNPFNPETTIKFSVPKQSFVTLKIYDVLGREIRTIINQEKPAGTFRVKLNSKGLASGIYFYRLTAGSFTQIKKMVLLK